MQRLIIAAVYFEESSFTEPTPFACPVCEMHSFYANEFLHLGRHVNEPVLFWLLKTTSEKCPFALKTLRRFTLPNTKCQHLFTFRLHGEENFEDMSVSVQLRKTKKETYVVADILWLLQTSLAKYQGQKVETSCCSVRINFYTSSSIYQISYCLSNNSRADTNWAKILTYKYKGFFSQAFWLYCKYFNFFLFWAASNGVH